MVDVGNPVRYPVGLVAPLHEPRVHAGMADGIYSTVANPPIYRIIYFIFYNYVIELDSGQGKGTGAPIRSRKSFSLLRRLEQRQLPG